VDGEFFGLSLSKLAFLERLAKITVFEDRVFESCPY
jgi:hypothetical protein